MPISKEQSVEIKKQIIGQVESSQMENKGEIIKSIKEMNEEELEGFLKANNIPISGLDQPQGQPSPGGQGEGCVFCSIIKGEVPSHKLEETNKAIAILELNPLSEGHSIVLPKEHVGVDKLPKSAMTLAQKIAKRIKKKLKSEDIKIETSNFQGHTFINIIPIYPNKNLEKKQASEAELKKLQNKLELKKRSTRTNKTQPTKEDTTESINNLPKISFRIP
jgi:histidine triad (HIT) family protein